MEVVFCGVASLLYLLDELEALLDLMSHHVVDDLVGGVPGVAQLLRYRIPLGAVVVQVFDDLLTDALKVGELWRQLQTHRREN